MNKVEVIYSSSLILVNIDEYEYAVRAVSNTTTEMMIKAIIKLIINDVDRWNI